MRLWMDPTKMVAFNISLQDIQGALNRENVELPAGKVRGDATEMTVKTFGRLTTEDDFNNMIIRQTAGQTIRFRDVGEAVRRHGLETTGRERVLRPHRLA